MSAQPNTEIAQRTPQQQLVADLRAESFMEQVSYALPENVTAKRFVRIAITALHATPSLATLERESVFRALLECAAMGLMPDGKQAALVPFKGKAQLLPMIAGRRLNAAEYGWEITARVVYENDEFDYTLGLHPTITHRPARIGTPRGDRIAVYAYGTHRDGRKSEPIVMDAATVEKHRALSQQPNGELWTKHTDKAWEKTAGHQCFKTLALADDDRVIRVLASEELSPREASTALYGHPNPPVTGELPRATPASAEAPADAAAAEGQPHGDGDQQADAGDSPSEPPHETPTSASAPEFEGEEPADHSPFQQPRVPEERRQVELEGEQAAHFVVNLPKYKGLTLAQIDVDKRDPGYIMFLAGPTYVPKNEAAHEVKRAAQAYAQAYFGGGS